MDNRWCIIDGWMGDGWINGCMDGWMDDGWIDG